VTIFRRGDDFIAFNGEVKRRLYLVDFTSDKAQLDTCLLAKSSLSWIWNHRLANVGMNNLNKLLKGEQMLGLTNVYFDKMEFVVHVKSESKLVLLTPSKKYSLLQDHWNYFTWISFFPWPMLALGETSMVLSLLMTTLGTLSFFMKYKRKVHEICKKFAKRAKNEFEVKIKRVRSDNGTEFKSTNIEEYLDEEGIGHELSAPYTPQQNGIMEMNNWTLIEAVRTMLDEYKTSDNFWVEAINTTCHAIKQLYFHK
jgi:hypothetical protein